MRYATIVAVPLVVVSAGIAAPSLQDGVRLRSIGAAGTNVWNDHPALIEMTLETDGFPSDITGDAFGEAFAGSTGVGGTIIASVVDDSFSNNSSLGGELCATFSWDDVVVSGPSSEVTLSVNALIDGFLSETENCGANLQGHVHVQGVNPAGGTSQETTFFYGPALPSGTGNIFTSTTLFEVITTDEITVDTGSPLELRLSLTANAVASPNFMTIETTHAEWCWSFPTGQDVFNLPAGYTANSPSAHIIDNRFVPPSDCPCDRSGEGAVDINDLLDFMADWFANDASADFDNSGAVDINDLLGFLGCWFESNGGTC